MRSLGGYYNLNGFISEIEKEQAVRHWPLFRSCVNKRRHEKMIDIYTDTLKENDEDMKGMLLLLEIMMTFSASRAACERGFSAMNRQKTKLRTSMSHKTLDNVMRICVDGGDVTTFDPNPHFISWRDECKGDRHIAGHKLSGK